MFRTHKSRLARIIATSALLLTASCAVGPKFKKPAPPDVGGYTPTPISATNSTANVDGGEEQHFDKGLDIPGEWWILFHSKPLNDLIERSLKTNPDLKAAQAALLVARENMLAQRGFYYPGRFRSKPENGGVAPSARAAGAFCPGRDAYHVELKRRRRRHTRGITAGAD